MTKKNASKKIISKSPVVQADLIPTPEAQPMTDKERQVARVKAKRAAAEEHRAAADGDKHTRK
jgi:hypothetical protein